LNKSQQRLGTGAEGKALESDLPRGLALVTRNEREFRRVPGLDVIAV
jgi:hypothetical protein